MLLRYWNEISFVIFWNNELALSRFQNLVLNLIFKSFGYLIINIIFLRHLFTRVKENNFEITMLSINQCIYFMIKFMFKIFFFFWKNITKASYITLKDTEIHKPISPFSVLISQTLRKKSGMLILLFYENYTRSLHWEENAQNI